MFHPSLNPKIVLPWPAMPGSHTILGVMAVALAAAFAPVATPAAELDNTHRFLANYDDPLIRNFSTAGKAEDPDAVQFTSDKQAAIAQLKLPVFLFNLGRLVPGLSKKGDPATEGLDSARRIDVTVEASKSLIIDDEEGDWYSAQYNTLDPNLEIELFCSRRAPLIVDTPLPGALPTEAAAKAQAEGRVDLVREVEDGHYEYSATLNFEAASIPCSLQVVCMKQDDPRCANEDFVRSLGDRERLEAVFVPRAD